ncbi:MAG: hypothetical protein QNJ62_04960 [Methyloceanibacter sp.]|nr:hypothetical protein [Methyloceanibacter sp.]
MVQEAREQARLRPVEDEVEKYARQCDFFGVRPIARADFHVRRLDLLPNAIEHVRSLLRTMESMEMRRKASAKMSHREQAMLASEYKAAVQGIHSAMRHEARDDLVEAKWHGPDKPKW